MQPLAERAKSHVGYVEGCKISSEMDSACSSCYTAVASFQLGLPEYLAKKNRSLYFYFFWEEMTVQQS